MTDRQTDMKTVIVAFRNVAKAPKILQYFNYMTLRDTTWYYVRKKKTSKRDYRNAVFDNTSTYAT